MIYLSVSFVFSKIVCFHCALWTHSVMIFLVSHWLRTVARYITFIYILLSYIVLLQSFLSCPVRCSSQYNILCSILSLSFISIHPLPLSSFVDVSNNFFGYPWFLFFFSIPTFALALSMITFLMWFQCSLAVTGFFVRILFSEYYSHIFVSYLRFCCRLAPLIFLYRICFMVAVTRLLSVWPSALW